MNLKLKEIHFKENLNNPRRYTGLGKRVVPRLCESRLLTLSLSLVAGHEFMQPRDHSLAQPCKLISNKLPGDTLSKLKSPPKTANTTSSVSSLVLAARKVAKTSLAWLRATPILIQNFLLTAYTWLKLYVVK